MSIKRFIAPPKAFSERDAKDNSLLKSIIRYLFALEGALAGKFLDLVDFVNATEWQAWTPSFTGAVLSGYDTARYCKVNKICFFSFNAITKNLSGTSGAIKISLPFAVSASTGYQFPHGAIFNGAAWTNAAYMDIASGASIVNVYKTADAGAWVGNETGVAVIINGFYEID